MIVSTKEGEDPIKACHILCGWPLPSSYMTSFPAIGSSHVTSATFWQCSYVDVIILPVAGQNLQHDLHHQLQVLGIADPLHNRYGVGGGGGGNATGNPEGNSIFKLLTE
jgi:hypothetical protein